MRFCIFTLLFVLLIGPAQAQLRCETKVSDDWCVPLLACFGEGGLWFKGQAYGRRSGQVTGQLSNGASCVGQWSSSVNNREGGIQVQCEDGRSAQLAFDYADPSSGTAIAKGSSNRGEKITAWSGRFLPDYLRDVLGMPENKLVCGASTATIS